MNRNAFELTLLNSKIIAPNTKHFVFKSPHILHCIPGQFITLYFTKEDKLLHRSYSLANYGQEGTTTLELAATYVPNGIASEVLFHMKPGDTILATGPVGRLTLRDEIVKRYLLIATGTGVTPYRAMLPELSKRMHIHPELKVILLFGTRYPEDVLYREEFVQFAQTHERFNFQVCYSRYSKPFLEYEYTGYVTHALKNRIQITPEEDLAFLCGRPDMVNDARDILLAAGLKMTQIRQEKYISPK
jgi:ferredoxin-NADP reductase